jgi:hypothetical protein
MGGIAALADVVKSKTECASLVANQRLLSGPFLEDVFQQRQIQEENFPDGVAAL